ncbi:hypothetical protein DRE_02924 [Drechslerella stenobrocha 248]|uniref:CST complex subunit Stn1 N-terminal domain-containing protein n=1 Tax=Drechslerella stenobrocha 248 TaxID=1043628 RepID=W7HW13_9PEZI|nr:hypothetical protein DRE_02924 [Drechslerella stenobrocha 248]
MDPAPPPLRREVNRSQTYRKWVKLPLCDIAASLHSFPEYAADSTFFINGHPVRWVYVVGLVTCINDYEKRLVYTIDDGSGQTIDAVVQKSDYQGMRSIPALHSTVKAKGQLELVHGAFQMKVMSLETGLTLDAQVKFWAEASETHEKLKQHDHTSKHVKHKRALKS